MLAVGSRQPGRGSQGRFPANCRVWVQVVLEKLFLRTGSQTQENQTCSATLLMIRMPTGWRCCLTLTLGTLKATGSMVDLVSISAAAISTSCTLHSVLGKKAKPWTRGEWKRREPWRRHCGHNRRRTRLSTLCGSAELKLLQSRK